MTRGISVSSRVVLGPFRRRRRRFTNDQIATQRQRAREWVFTREDIEHRGLIFVAGENRPFLLHFYGAGMSVDHEIGRLAWLAERGLNVACVDLRGYGRTGTAWDPTRLIADAIGVHDQLRFLAGTQPIHVHGFSMGAVLAAHVAAARDVASMILLAPPASLNDCRDDFFARFPPARWVHERWPFQFEPALTRLLDAQTPVMDSKTPLLILHGDQDRTVSLRQGEKIYWASASPLKRFLPAQSFTHCSLPWNGGVYEQALIEWFGEFDLPFSPVTQSPNREIPLLHQGIEDVTARNPRHDWAS